MYDYAHMLKKEDVEKLANLSRINISDDEKEQLIVDLDAILGYVDQVQEAAKDAVEQDYGFLENIHLREDSNPHEEGAYTQAILDTAPDTEKGYLKVKKIL